MQKCKCGSKYNWQFVGAITVTGDVGFGWDKEAKLEELDPEKTQALIAKGKDAANAAGRNPTRPPPKEVDVPKPQLTGAISTEKTEEGKTGWTGGVKVYGYAEAGVFLGVKFVGNIGEWKWGESWKWKLGEGSSEVGFTGKIGARIALVFEGKFEGDYSLGSTKPENGNQPANP